MERLFSSSARMNPRAGVRPAYGTLRRPGPAYGARRVQMIPSMK